MGFLGIALIVIFIATSVLLVGVVLLQDEQGEGLGGIFGGGSSTPFGSRGGNILTRFTSILGAIFLFCSFGIAWANRSTQAGDVLAAAKKAQANQTTDWWNASVSSNQNITPGSGTSAAPATGQSNAQAATGSGAASAPSSSTGGSAQSNTPGQSQTQPATSGSGS